MSAAVEIAHGPRTIRSVAAKKPTEPATAAPAAPFSHDTYVEGELPQRTPSNREIRAMLATVRGVQRDIAKALERLRASHPSVPSILLEYLLNHHAADIPNPRASGEPVGSMMSERVAVAFAASEMLMHTWGPGVDATELKAIRVAIAALAYVSNRSILGIDSHVRYGPKNEQWAQRVRDAWAVMHGATGHQYEWCSLVEHLRLAAVARYLGTDSWERFAAEDLLHTLHSTFRIKTDRLGRKWLSEQLLVMRNHPPYSKTRPSPERVAARIILRADALHLTSRAPAGSLKSEKVLAAEIKAATRAATDKDE